MDIKLEPGRYVLAVSGGVDSMVLLDLLRTRPDLKLTVAHFDHGIREDSHEDRRLVQDVARRHGLPFVYAHGNLGPGASEAEAREARYEFLRKVRNATGAKAIITAHHQDDLLETVVMNILRGTGRKGLSPLATMHDVHRPLLHLPKHVLHSHARDNQLVWREDSTNNDQKYLRNYIRHNLLPRLNEEATEQLLILARNQASINHEIDTLLVNQLHFQDKRDALNRSWFMNLSHKVAKEVLATWLRSHNLGEFDRKTLDRLVVGAKVSNPGKALDIIKNSQLHIEPKYLLLRRHSL
jgi:tRNA(Ile)-lysidine synthase